MLKAVLRNGVIVPLEPLPPEWHDGQELNVEPAPAAADEPDVDSDEYWRQLDALAAQITKEDERTLDAALAEADRIAKEQVRREMGLP